jgi:hypothetical protein
MSYFQCCTSPHNRSSCGRFRTCQGRYALSSDFLQVSLYSNFFARALKNAIFDSEHLAIQKQKPWQKLEKENLNPEIDLDLKCSRDRQKVTPLNIRPLRLVQMSLPTSQPAKLAF